MHTWYLSCNGCADFGFGIFEELHKRRNQITVYYLFVDSFRNLL